MTEQLEDAVAQHYGVPDLKQRIVAGAAAAGLDLDGLTHQQLAPVDEFHIGGRSGTEYAVAKMALTGGEHVLDIGCGIGGTARYLASSIGCRVTGIDLTPDYIDVARALTEQTELGDRADFQVGSALEMPFADAAFDAAITIHVAMNIADRAGLYREIARVLKPGAAFCLFDLMQGSAEGLSFPVPWATSAATSHLARPDAMPALLSDAGFRVDDVDDRTGYATTFMRERLADTSDGPPPMGLHLLMGATARQKFENVLDGLERGSLTVFVMTARRI